MKPNNPNKPNKINKQNQKKESAVKTVVITTIIIILLLLIMFSEDIMKMGNTVQLQQSAEEQTITVTGPNIPKLSAGMIPVKWDGTSWVITTQDDEEWYDYTQGKLAHIMLNDGVYQSEPIKDMANKKLAERNIGMQIQPTELGTIFAWVPRFAENIETGEIKYVEETVVTEGEWEVSDLFTYIQNDLTKPDYFVSGTWVQKEIDASYTTKITQMQQEESVYGFLAHTKATAITSTEQTAIQKYMQKLNTSTLPFNNITDIYRITLKVIDENNHETIKAKVEFIKLQAKITVQVTYNQFPISKIQYEQDGQIADLTMTQTSGTTTADTTGIELENGIHTIIITDNNNNKKEIKVEVVLGIYVTYYTDGTLAFANIQNPLTNKTVSAQYADIVNAYYAWDNTRYQQPWYSQRENITTVNITEKISPTCCAGWFHSLTSLTQIVNIENLDTSNVHDMNNLFYNCKALTSLDVTNFNTSNVAYMQYMFAACNVLTSLNVSSFNTRNVQDMSYMFGGCNVLTSLNLNNFDTSNVRDMTRMFNGCRALTSLNLNNFDTSNVTTMEFMFGNCSGLTSLNVSSFNTSNVTNMANMFLGCSKLTSLDLRSFDTKQVTNMNYMFNNCSNLTTITVSSSNWVTTQATIVNMFAACGTSSVTKV